MRRRSVRSRTGLLYLSLAALAAPLGACSEPIQPDVAPTVQGAPALFSTATDPCHDPIDGFGDRWLLDGDLTPQPHLPGTPYLIVDDVATAPAGSKPFLTVYCFQPASVWDGWFQTTATVDVNTNTVTASQGNTGIHLTLNDGARQIRVVVREFPEGLGVSYEYAPDQFSTGLLVQGRQMIVTLARDPSSQKVFLSVAGSDTRLEALFDDFAPPSSGRQGTVEFGTYNVVAQSETNWRGLGLPRRAEVPLEVSIHPGSGAVPIRLSGPIPAVSVVVRTTTTFDAALLIPATATLGDGSGADVAIAKGPNGTPLAQLLDTDRDGDKDLVLVFNKNDLVAAGELTSATNSLVLRANLQDGRRARGQAAVAVVP